MKRLRILILLVLLPTSLLGYNDNRLGPPYSVLGGGVTTCSLYLLTVKRGDMNAQIGIDEWVYGYFSARNLVGHEDHPLTVGGSLGPLEFNKLLTEQCQKASELRLVESAEALYNKLQAERR